MSRCSALYPYDLVCPEKIAESSQIQWNCLLNPTVIRCIPRWGQTFGWLGLTVLERLGGSAEDWQRGGLASTVAEAGRGAVAGSVLRGDPLAVREVARAWACVALSTWPVARALSPDGTAKSFHSSK